MNDAPLLSCPFCGAGESRIDEKRYWTGMRSQIVSVELRHWCEGAKFRSYLCIRGQTRDEVIEKWNTRVPVVAPDFKE